MPLAISTHWADGGDGARELAEAVADACAQPSRFRLLYEDDLSIKDKISRIASEVYGAAGVPCALVSFGPEGPGIARLDPDALLHRYADLPALVERLLA